MPFYYPFFNQESRWYYPLRWLFLVLLGLAIYSQTFGFNFVFDDNAFIMHNSFVKRLDHVQYVLKQFPLTRTIGFYSFAFNYYLGKLNPVGYHVFNFIIHLLSVGLVWALSGLLFKLAGDEFKDDIYRRQIPFVIAVFFLVHPCQTEAITYISQRFESMATVFYLSSIYAYIRARLASSRKSQTLFFILSFVSAILGILTKEVAATIPMMILALELIFFGKKSHRAILILIGILFFIIFTRFVRTGLDIFYNFGAIPSESHDGDMITTSKYLLTQMRVFLTFMRLLVLPIHQNLDYDYPLSRGIFDPPLTFVGLSMIVAMLYSILRLRNKFPVIAFGLAWILITFSINLAPRANVIFEHKLYLISFGFFLAFVSVLFNIVRRRNWLVGIILSMIAVLSFMCFQRNRIWENELTLWADVVEKSPHKARSQTNLGVEHYNQHKYVQALVDYNQAIEINPNYQDAYNDRGVLYKAEGKYNQALKDFTKAIKIDPGYLDSYINRSLIYDLQGKYSEANDDYKKALEINPNDAIVYYNRGLSYARRRNYVQAISEFTNAIQIDPNSAIIYNNRGLSFAQERHFKEAIFDYTHAVFVDPSFADAYSNRGVIWASLGNFFLAVSDFDQAIKIDPKNANAYCNRGNIYYQQGQVVQAIDDYNKAVQINPDNLQAIHNRAMAYEHLKK